MQERLITLTTCFLCSVFVIIKAIPMPNTNQELDVLQIPLENGKEIDVLTLGPKEEAQVIAERNKRTIGLLRELFPDITKQIDDQANRIISKILRTLGPSILRTAIQGNSANSVRSNFDADFDEDDDKVKSNDSSSNSIDSRDDNMNSSRVTIELPTFEPEDEENSVWVSDDNKSDIFTTTEPST